MVPRDDEDDSMDVEEPPAPPPPTNSSKKRSPPKGGSSSRTSKKAKGAGKSKKPPQRVSPIPQDIKDEERSADASPPQPEVSSTGRSRRGRPRTNYAKDPFADLDFGSEDEEDEEDIDVDDSEDDFEQAVEESESSEEEEKVSTTLSTTLSPTIIASFLLAPVANISTSLLQFDSDDDLDIHEEDSAEEKMDDILDMDNDPDIKPKKKGKAAKTASRSTSKPDDGKVKMSDKFDPINNPQNYKLAYDEVLDYSDPCGLESHDDIILRILDTQFSSVGELLVPSMQQQALKDGVKLHTACSGTDAPALALQMFVEIAKSYNRELKYEHLLSCEIEPFKQAYLQNNFDSIIYPDIGKLSSDEPRDIFGVTQPIPEGNFFIAGTVCKNFSMMRGATRIDIEDRGQSGETFLAAVEFLDQQGHEFALFENVIGAPWEKMAEYITGVVPVWLNPKNKISVDKKEKAAASTMSFVKVDNKYVADTVGGFWGVKAGQALKGIKRSDGTYEDVKWEVTGKSSCTLETLKKVRRAC